MTRRQLHLTSALARGAVKTERKPLDHSGYLPHEIHEVVEQWFAEMVALIRRRGRREFRWEVPLNRPWPLPVPTIVSRTHGVVFYAPDSPDWNSPRSHPFQPRPWESA